jgi:L-2-hydroxyglutarate oxidase
VQLATSRDEYNADLVINCSGLYSDTLFEMSSNQKGLVRIIPFRGEYFDIIGESAKLVNGPVYPVPDTRFPFLGVHVTKSVDGLVHAGPNAVFALSREGYKWSDIRIRETLDTVTSKAFLRLARQNLSVGCYEVLRSWSKRMFHKDVCRLFPEISISDLRRSVQSGVRAQAVDTSGRLVDDFKIERTQRVIHVLNAPSPAATSSLAIGKHITQIAVEAL